MTNTDPLVAELRTLRRMLGVRATDIATTTGLDLATISHWECGRFQPRLMKFRDYAAAIGFELQLVPTDEHASRVALAVEHRLTPDEIRALADCAVSWLQLGDDPTLRAALDKLTPAEPDADTYPPDYPLAACQPADPTA